MKRLGKEKKDKPKLHVELSPKYKKLRGVLAVLLLVLGVVLIAIAVGDYFNVEPGWTTITVSGTDSYSGEFVFQYYLGASGKAPNREEKEVKEFYSKVTKEAYQIFSAEQLFGEVHNLAYLSAHPNENVQVPPALYDALALLNDAGSRALFMAPIYQLYTGLFMSEEEWTAKTFDPTKNADAAAYVAKFLSFINDKNAISLELLRNHEVVLHVSEEYLKAAKSEGVMAFADFYWMKNAFIADYLAEELTKNGYTHGNLSSYDGFVRNLDTTDRAYRINIFDRVEDNAYAAATLEYKNVGAFVTLHNYPTSKLSTLQYRQWADGTITSCFIDPQTGLSKTAINDLMGYSKTLSCAQIVIKLFPIYVADALDTNAIVGLEGVETVYCQNREIYTSDRSATLLNLYSKDDITYKKH